MNTAPGNMAPETIAAFLSRQLSDEEAARVQLWIDASAENRKYFEQFRAVYEETGKLIPAPVDVDVDAAWNFMSGQIDAYEQGRKSSRGNTTSLIFRPAFLIRAAAVIVPLAVIGSLLLFTGKKPEVISRQTIAQVARDTLSDGTLVSINRNSKIAYPKKFDKKTREVSMEGEVFFKVKPDPEKPFIIHTGETMIRVLGTSFNVKAYTDSSYIEVYVISGIVEFSEKEKDETERASIRLEAGEKGIYNKNTRIITKASEADMNELFWESRKLVFVRSDLPLVIETLQDKFGVQIELLDRKIEDFHFSASFDDQPVDSVMQVIVQTFDLKMSKEGTHYFLDRNEP